MKNLSLIIALFGLVLYSCQAPESVPDLDQLKAEIQQMENELAKGYNERNVEAVMPYYAEDANTLHQNELTVVGKEAIREYLTLDFESDNTGNKQQYEVVDVFADGNLVVEVGKYIDTDPDGTETTGKYIAIFENRNGKLVCIRDMSNSDAPDESLGQLKKGNLVGVHTITVNLNPGVTMDQYVGFLNENWIPEAENLWKNSNIHITKGVRGESENSIGMIMIFKTEADRDRYYNEDGSDTELGKEVAEKFQPVVDEAIEKYGTYSSTYTDWIVQ